jgi:ribulose-phosphate 3-epimerase
MKLIAPSILSADGSKLGEEIIAVEKAGANWIHIDVMDGNFVPNITMGPSIISSLRRMTKLPFDVHLMIADPDRHIESFVNAGADIITVHVETCAHLHRSVEIIRGFGTKAGVSLNPATPLEFVREIIHHIDLLLVMSVNPGFGGQQFIPTMLPKIARASKLLDSLPQRPLLEVDGGINLKNIGDIALAGTDVFVAGAAIFGTQDYLQTISALRKAATGIVV